MRTKAHLLGFGWILLAPIALAQETTNDVRVPFQILQTGHVAPNHDYRLELPVPHNEPHKPRVLVIYSESELVSIWPQLQAQNRSHQPQTTPGLDFAKSLLVLFLAARDSTCNGYGLRQVRESLQKVTLRVSHLSTGRNCMCASEIVEPYIMISMPYTRKTIDFQIDREERPACGSGGA